MPRFHETIPDCCNPNLTDEQIAELVQEGLDALASGDEVVLGGPDAVRAFMRETMPGREPTEDKAA